MPFGTLDIFADPTISYPHIVASLLGSIALFNIGDTIKLPFIRYDGARYGPLSRLEVYSISMTLLAIAAGLECWAFAREGHTILFTDWISLFGIFVLGLVCRPLWHFLNPTTIRSS